ncbi:MAG: protein-disulfide reductase DsbD family protein [Puniceicoccaceae bacterium]
MKQFTRYWRVLLLLSFIWQPLKGQVLGLGLDENQPVEAELVAESGHIQPGVPTRIGLLLKHQPKWHTYWINSATGYPTTIEWDLPEGFSISKLHWPTPSLYVFGGFTEYVYEGTTLVTATLYPPADLTGDSVEIGFTADWLMCEDVCIPGGAKGTLSLPVASALPQPSGYADRFRQAEQEQPASEHPYSITAWVDGQQVFLEVSGPQLPDSAYFFDQQLVLNPAEEATVVSQSSGTLTLVIPLSESTSEIPEKLTGVLKAAGGWPALDGRPGLAIEVNLTAPSITTKPATPSWPATLLLAFIGGMILNLMPCVFPVLGIKIMGFVNQAGESRRKIVMHGLVFTGGVILSFWVLTAFLLVLRSGGNQLGWGFQLQSPAFVLALALILFGFGLNMSGLFEVGQSAVGVGSKLTGKSGLAGTFFSGVLATVVATPCAAPFLAPALGAALALPPLYSFLVFTVIAIGLSTPYLVLSAFPSLIRWLPKPGAWMETFKQVMAFLLYGTVAYLLWVLAGQLTEASSFGPFSFLKVLFSLVLLAVALWIFGRWAAFHRRPMVRRVGTVVAALFLMAAIGTGISGTRKGPSAWDVWEPGKAEQLAASGKLVYVDFTARWCVTCQTNKAAVFSSDKVRKAIADMDVVLLKADWTNKDSRISEELARYNRSAVPFNLVYGPGSPEPLILPEILTPGIVLEALERASRQ